MLGVHRSPVLLLSSAFLAACAMALAGCGGDLALPDDGTGGAGPPTGPASPAGATISASDDRFTTLEGGDQTLAVAPPGVLANDRVDGAETEGLTAVATGEPSHGRVDLRSDGSLNYTPDHDWFGTDRFTYRAALGSVTSPEAEVVIQVDGLNDSPRFTPGPDQEVKRGKKEQKVEHWARDIVAGPANEADQKLDFRIKVVSGADNLSGTPTVSSSGTLYYKPSRNSGTARVEVRLHDDGGTANGGVDTSPPHTLVITVKH